MVANFSSQSLRSTLFQLLDLGFQFADALLEFRKATQGGRVFQPEAIVYSGRTGADGIGRDVAGKTALRGDDDAVADGEVTGGRGLAGENAVVADLSGAGEAGLATDHVVSAQLRGVADEHQIVELGAAADAGLADGGAI